MVVFSSPDFFPVYADIIHDLQVHIMIYRVERYTYLTTPLIFSVKI